MKKLLKAPTVKLYYTGAHVDWGTDKAFRQLLTPKRLKRLVSAADTIQLRVVHIGGEGCTVTPQKGSTLAMVARIPDDALIACTFNGLDLVILGRADVDMIDIE